jgi:Ca2+-binding EF-hand superfamily protein
MAPEVLKGDYDSKVDLWSIGVIAYMLLASSLPFYGKTRKNVVSRILRGKWSFKGRRWEACVSQAAKDFITSLLSVYPEKRPTAEKALQMTWLKRSKFGAPISYLLMDNVLASIRTFASYGRLKKLALLVVAYKSTDEELGFLRKIFGKFDITHHGEIEREEFKEAMAAYHYDKTELERMFIAMDIDATGKVHYSEFLAATLEAHGSINERRIAEAFDRLDSDDSGFITVDNLKEFLGEEVSDEYIDSIIDEVDENNDHKIEYTEFLDLWNDNSVANLTTNLVDVYMRRETYESSDNSDTRTTMSRVSSISTDDGMAPEGFSNYSQSYPGERKGGYFFELEKERSLRGVRL